MYNVMEHANPHLVEIARALGIFPKFTDSFEVSKVDEADYVLTKSILSSVDSYRELRAEIASLKKENKSLRDNISELGWAAYPSRNGW